MKSSRTKKPSAVFKNTALIQAGEDPRWQSNKNIRSNIIRTYHYLDKQIPLLQFQNLDDQELASIVRTLKSKRIKKLIFVQSSPHPLPLFLILKKELSQVEEFCFHIYGDFTSKTDQWQNLFQHLKNKKVKLLTASMAQAKLVQKFLNLKSQLCVECIPFPLDQKLIILDPPQRQQLRQQMGFDKKDFVITTMGRISPEKNVNCLIKFIQKFVQQYPQVKKTIKIQIAGSFDDYGFTFLNNQLQLGEYFHHWNKWFETLPRSFKKNIEFKGFVTGESKNQLLQCSDLFISLSTFHDEDFGLAPLEALSLGCPALLTNWGGYSDFQITTTDVQLTPVQIKPSGIQISYYHFASALEFFIQQNKNDDRLARARKYGRVYSVTGIAKKYLASHSQPYSLFKGSSELLQQHSQKISLKLETGQPVYSSYSEKDALYTEVYSSYLGPMGKNSENI